MQPSTYQGHAMTNFDDTVFTRMIDEFNINNLSIVSTSNDQVLLSDWWPFGPVKPDITLKRAFSVREDFLNLTLNNISTEWFKMSSMFC